MPWKNGGGTTVEIAVHPEGAGLSAFDWRISMAEVAADGPFSRFPGVERTLAVLSGAGILLDFGRGAGAVLTRQSPPLRFPADVDCNARLIDGPITDLNIMVRRGCWRAEVAPVTGIVLPAKGPAPEMRLVVVTEGAFHLGAARLEVGDTLWLLRDEASVVGGAFAAGGGGYVVDLFADGH